MKSHGSMCGCNLCGKVHVQYARVADGHVVMVITPIGQAT